MKSRQYLLNAIKANQPKMRKAFEAAIANVATDVKLNELVEYIRTGNLFAAQALIETNPESFVAIEDALREVHRAGFDATVENMPRILREGSVVVMRLNPRNERAERWLAEKSATLIKDISDSTRETIRAHLTYGVQNGINPRKVALELLGQKGADGIRRGGLIGLTPNQLSQVQSYRKALESGDFTNALNRALRDKRYDRLLKSGKKLTTKQIDDITSSYQNRYVKHRATVIAQQETRVALAQSNREAFQQTLDKGYLKEQEIKRFWITRRDSRVRDEHEKIPSMNRKGVGLNEPFNTPDGSVYDAPHGIGCRCYVDVRVISNK